MRSTFSWKTWLMPAAATAATACVMLSITGCNGCAGNSQAPIVNSASGADPADANLAQPGSAPAGTTGQPTQVMGTSQSYTPQQQSESYNYPQTQQAATIVQGYPVQDYPQQQGAYDSQQAYDSGYDNGQAQGYAQAEADQPPPPLPEYDQPPAPDDNDIWTPGYWAYGNSGYYWTPGVWVSAPYVGALWTPGYWGWYSNRYRWHHGYWGPHIGYYGGINYGYGYVGTGYYGGYWNGPRFFYNRSVTRVSPRVTTVYERNVIVNNVRYTSVTNNRISYNGGRGGVEAQPRPYEVAAMHEQHVGPLPAQQQFHQQAANNRANFFNENHGRPAMAAATTPVAVQHIAAPAGAERGGFGQRPGEPAANNNFNRSGEPNNNRPGEPGNNNINRPGQPPVSTGAAHNAPVEQQRGFPMQQQQQHNEEMQRNAQIQQQRSVQPQQQHIQQQIQQNNAMEQQRAQESQQRNALMQQHQQQQMEQQRQVQEQQQRNVQMQQQQRPVENGQRGFQPQQQPRPMEQPHIQPQPQHMEQARPVEQPRAQPQPQHIEQPHTAPPPQPHAAPAPHPPEGGNGHPGGGHPR